LRGLHGYSDSQSAGMLAFAQPSLTGKGKAREMFVLGMLGDVAS